MSHANQILRPTRGQLIFVLLTAAAAAVLLLSIQGPTARAEVTDTCEGGKFCVWEGVSFNGQEFNVNCFGETSFVGLEKKSAKNHCSVNVRIGWQEGGSTNWKACMSPGGERPEPGRFNKVVPSGC